MLEVGGLVLERVYIVQQLLALELEKLELLDPGFSIERGAGTRYQLTFQYRNTLGDAIEVGVRCFNPILDILHGSHCRPHFLAVLISNIKRFAQIFGTYIVMTATRFTEFKTLLRHTKPAHPANVSIFVSRDIGFDPVVGAGLAMTPDLRQRLSSHSVFQTYEPPVSLFAFGFIESRASLHRYEQPSDYRDLYLSHLISPVQ